MEYRVEGVGRDEAETTVSFMRGEREFELYTSDNTVLTKLGKLASKPGSGWRLVRIEKDPEGKVTGYFFKGTMRCLSFRSGVKRELTAEERENLRLRAERMRGEAPAD